MADVGLLRPGLVGFMIVGDISEFIRRGSADYFLVLL